MQNQRVALVTGGADGIGWATAQQFAKAGWRVALFDLNGEQSAERAKSLGHPHCGFRCDVTHAGEVQTRVAEVVALCGRIDALVNNAGIADQTAPTLQQNIEAFDKVLSVHLRGAFLMSQQVIAQMLQQARDSRGSRGAIVNLGSIASVAGLPGRNAYCAAKAGVLGMTRALARELGSRNITVNCVAPGFIATDMTANLPDEQQKALLVQIPLGHLGQPEDIAHAVAYLAGANASYVTGQELHVNGGMFMA